MGYDLVITSRNEEKLSSVAAKMKNNTQIITADLTKTEECIRLVKLSGDIDVLVNNAGMGVFGLFSHTPLLEELQMIDLNVKALHTLTKIYLKRFIEKDSGFILNVASVAAFFPGPKFSSYYASKAYVLRLSQAVSDELKREKSHVSVSVFCPGPVDTDFNINAGAKKALGGISAEKAARKAVFGMFMRKRVIACPFSAKLLRIAAKIIPDTVAMPFIYKIQSGKEH